jgi:putative sigma-54 modulation protein
MKLNIKATQIKLTPEIKDYIQKKMDMLEKFLGHIPVINCDIEVALTTTHHVKGEIYRAEVNLEVPGELLRVEKTEKELKKAIDKVKDHLARSIKNYKEKMIDRKRKGE